MTTGVISYETRMRKISFILERRVKLLRFKNMRERVEYAYDKLNVDIYYEGNYYYTILDHVKDQFIEMLTEEQLDKELEIIRRKLKLTRSVIRSRA